MCVIDPALCLVRQTPEEEGFLSAICDLQETPAKVLCRHSGVFFICVMVASAIIAIF